MDINYCGTKKNRFKGHFWALQERGDNLTIIGSIKSKILDMANWSKHHLAQLIILAGVIILCLVVLVLFSWFVGFYCNGFYGMKFDLGSVWQGLGACVTAISGLLTVAGVQLGKHYVDSKYNSQAGEKPKSRLDDSK